MLQKNTLLLASLIFFSSGFKDNDIDLPLYKDNV